MVWRFFFDSIFLLCALQSWINPLILFCMGGMLLKTVIYLDILLLINFLIAYLLLQIVSLICSTPLTFKRSLLGATLASFSTLILLAPELPPAVMFLFKITSAFVVVFISFGFYAWRPLLREMFWFFLLNVLLAGVVLLAVLKGNATGMHMNNLTIYINISPILLFGCTLCVYGILRLMLFLFGTPEPKEHWSVHCSFNYIPLPIITALFDTGFLLQDPIGNNPAILVSFPAVQSSLPDELSQFLKAFFKGENKNPPPGVLIRMIPCKTVTGCRALPAVSGISIELHRNQEIYRVPNALMVFSQETLIDGSVQALFGRHFLQCAKIERSVQTCIKPS